MISDVQILSACYLVIQVESRMDLNHGVATDTLRAALRDRLAGLMGIHSEFVQDAFERAASEIHTPAALHEKINLTLA